jgi:methionyl aminopeptidase
MVLKSTGELELMDGANSIVHQVLDGIAERIGPGVTTAELDRWAERTIRESGGVPAFLNYRGYPATLCTSINDVIVHGLRSALQGLLRRRGADLRRRRDRQ